MDIRRFLVFGVLGVALGLCSMGEALAQTSRPHRASKPSGKALKTERIRGLDWHSSFEAALMANRKSQSKKKPIFFLRMLGELTGETWSAAHAMRTGTFSKKAVKAVLGRRFRLAWINLEGEETAGSSFAHSPTDGPVICFRGNGEHNVQMLMTTADGKLLNAFAGFASEKVLLEELAVALDLDAKIAGKKLFEQRKILVAAHKLRLGEVQNMKFKGVLGGLTKGRLVADRKYARDHALMDARYFETADMVGTASTFFGSSTDVSPKGRIGKSMGGIDIEALMKKHKKAKKRPSVKKKKQIGLVEI